MRADPILCRDIRDLLTQGMRRGEDTAPYLCKCQDRDGTGPGKRRKKIAKQRAQFKTGAPARRDLLGSNGAICV